MTIYGTLETAAGGRSLCAQNSLTADEETALSKRILAGEAAKNRLSGSENISENDRSALEQVIEDGTQAYEALVMANLPRAAKIAAETYRRNPHGLNEFEDYQQTAMKVICSCAKTYDWKLQCRFGTYVHRCLQNEMMRENARTGYALRIPEGNLSQLAALKRASELVGVDAAARDLGLNSDLAADLLEAGSICRSLQAPVTMDDPEMELGDMIADVRAMSAEEIEMNIDRESQLRKLRAAFSALSDDEQTLLKGRMGFGGDPLPMRAFVGTVAKSISGVQKKQEAAEKHLREIYFSLPMAD